ncbi:MAG: hypothetical protein JXO44_06525 [Clostridia bacterium]|nr:hypothetical protein [Clostridia bacterium]
MKKNKKLIALAALIIIAAGILYNGFLYIPMYMDGDFFIAQWVFRDTHHGDIIGNPDFVPSFIEVDESTFMAKYEATSEALGYKHAIKEDQPSPDKSFDYAFMLDDVFHIDYDEGFFIMRFDDFENHRQTLNEILHTCLVMLDPEIDKETLDDYLVFIQTADYEAYNEIYLSAKVGFRFYIEDGQYEVHVEDMRMGH